MSTGRRLGIVLAVGALLAVFASAALGAPTVNGEFAVTGTPSHLALGPDGNVWVTLSDGGNKLAKVTPDGAVTEYNPVSITGAPVGITAGPDGNMWVTDAGHVASFGTGDPASAAETAVAGITDPRGITTGPDGNLWTASADKLVKIPPGAPATATSVTIAGMGARDIASGTDGKLWIADFGGQQIVAATTAGVPTFHPVGGGPQGVAAGPGGQVGYTNPGAVTQTIGSLALGATPLSTDTPASVPFGMVFGSDGAYWTANFAAQNLGRLTTDGTYTTLPGLSAASGPRYITAGASNTLWVSLETAKKIARVTGVVAPATTGGGGTGGTGGTGGGGTTADTVAPVISGLGMASAFRVGAESTPLAAAGVATGTTIRFTL